MKRLLTLRKKDGIFCQFIGRAKCKIAGVSYKKKYQKKSDGLMALKAKKKGRRIFISVHKDKAVGKSRPKVRKIFIFIKRILS